MSRKHFNDWRIVFILAVLLFCANVHLFSQSVRDVIAYDLVNNYANPQHQIYTINSDGTGNAKLITASFGLNHMEYSPDGKKIALVGYMDYANTTWSIHLYDITSKSLQRITNDVGVWDSEPAWSPNGSMIAFTKVYQSQNMKNETWMMNADGSNARYIGVPGFQPKWSKDGTKLIYAGNPSGNWEIYTCNIDGSGVQRITNNTTDEFTPSWSPDGTKILFSSNRDGNSEIYSMNNDGTQVQRLTNNPAEEGSPKWSPDGTQIVFSSDRGRAQYMDNLYLMNADGSNVRQLTNLTSAYESAICPAWMPRTTTPVESGGANALPQNFKLNQNYPNPFNPSTTITYELSKESHVNIDLYDSLGKKVKSLVNEHMQSGRYSIMWDGTDQLGNKVSSGVYLYRMASNGFHQTCKLILSK